MARPSAIPLLALAAALTTLVPGCAARQPSPETELLRQARTQLAALVPARAAAVRAIRDAQQADGAFLTRITRRPAYRRPRNELNTWAPAMMIELLAPVAEELALEASLGEARAFLRSQIEPSGLVRFNRIDRLLPPDSDDTALVWVAAPAEDPRIPRILDVFEAYRTDAGLYRIWLAPGGIPNHPAAGVDPNPIDLVVQIHIHRFLAEHAPARADALCRAIQTHVHDPTLWPYYGAASWLFALREHEQADAGCPLPRPDSLRRWEAPGQAIYFEAAELLQGASPGAPRDAIAARLVDVLHRMAADDFAHFESDPLLLYHNDPTSRVPRFYWSKELAYALFLRLERAAREVVDGPPPTRNLATR